MDPKQTNWAEMPSDEDLSPHGNQKQENPILDESLPNQETTQVSMARNYKRKPQLTKEEIISKIKSIRGEVSLNLLNVDYKAKEQDIMELYSDIKVVKIEFQQKGIFMLLVKDAEEALKIFTGEERNINGRNVTVRLGAPKKREDYEKNEGNFNKQRRPPQEGGYNKKYGENKPYNNNKDFKTNSYNRKDYHESNHFGDEGYQKTKPRPQVEKPKEEIIEKKPEESNRKPFGFTRGTGVTKPVEKKEEISEQQQPKPQKSNPFGAARPRDENEYAKKKKEENKEELVEEIKELKETPLVVEKPKEKVKVQEKKEIHEEEFIVTNKKKNNRKNQDKAPVVQKETPKIEETNDKAKAKKKPTTTDNLFNRLAAGEGEEEDDQ